ncbi:MAG: hypothetical protein ACREQ5_16425 [Candidatus Dormibacteria bacterium]
MALTLPAPSHFANSFAERIGPAIIGQRQQPSPPRRTVRIRARGSGDSRRAGSGEAPSVEPTVINDRTCSTGRQSSSIM